jgi:transposase
MFCSTCGATHRHRPRIGVEPCPSEWVSETRIRSTVPPQKSTRIRDFSRFLIFPPHPPFLLHHHIIIRAPLSSISGNRRRHSEHTPYQRGLAAGAITYGARPCQLQKNFGISRHTTRTIVDNVLVRHNGESKLRSGRPKKLSIRDERHVLRIVRRDPKITYKNLAEKAGVSVSHDTLYRLLKGEGITNWLCKKRPLLTPEMAGKRYAWALAHEHWNFEEWAKVVWSDECSVARGTGR